MSYQPIFNFDRNDYEVAFEIIETGFIERLFTRKATKNKYYIRVAGKSPESVLCKYTDEDRYEFDVDRSWLEPVYFKDPTEPQQLLSNSYNKKFPNTYNVVFSTKDLRNL
jgi:hypothetical protein